MKKGSLFILEIICVLLITVLFALVLEYKREEVYVDKTWNTGNVMINEKVIKLPISMEKLKKEVGDVTLSQNEIKSAYIEGNTTMAKKYMIKNEEVRLLLKNDSSKEKQLSECEVVGIYISPSVIFFGKISYNTSINDIEKVLKPGILNTYQKKESNILTYEKEYGIKVEDAKNILYYYVEK